MFKEKPMFDALCTRPYTRYAANDAEKRPPKVSIRIETHLYQQHVNSCGCRND